MPEPVVLISGKHPESAGGHKTYVRAHGLAAIRAGFEPHIFCADYKAGVVAHDYGVVHTLAFPLPMHNAYTIVYQPFLVAQIEEFLRGHSPPYLIHGFGTWSCAGVSVKRRMASRGVKAVAVAGVYSTVDHENRVHVRRSRIEYGLGKWLNYRFQYAWTRAIGDRFERNTYEASDLILVNYDSVRRLLLDSYDLKASIRKIPYSSVMAFRDPMPGDGAAARPILDRLEPRNAPLIVSVSRHTPRKGIDLLLRALADLDRKGIAFRACLAGPGKLIEAHRRLAGELGLSGKVVMPGRVDEPFDFLRRADIFVLPSLEEASGSLSLLEAMQAGAAIVASACDGIPEDLTAGEDAILFPPGDAPALSRALANLISDEGLRKRLAERARATYERRFSAPAFTTALAATYRDLGFTP